MVSTDLVSVSVPFLGQQDMRLRLRRSWLKWKYYLETYLVSQCMQLYRDLKTCLKCLSSARAVSFSPRRFCDLSNPKGALRICANDLDCRLRYLVGGCHAYITLNYLVFTLNVRIRYTQILLLGPYVSLASALIGFSIKINISEEKTEFRAFLRISIICG